MTVPINFRPEAVDEIDATFQWYEEQRAGLGEEFLSALLDQLNRIQDNPEGWAVLYRHYSCLSHAAISVRHLLSHPA